MRPHRRPGLSLTEVLVALFVMALGLIALLTLFPLGAMQIGQALKDDRTAQTANQADNWLRAYWRNEVAAAYRASPDALPLGDNLATALDDANVERNGTFPAGNPTAPTTYFQVPDALGGPNLLPFGNTLNPAASAGADLTTTRTSLLSVTILVPNPGAVVNLAVQRFVSIQSRLAAGNRPSYPVLIDPLGYLARATALPFEKTWVGRNSVGTGTGGVYGTNPGVTPLLIPRRNTQATQTANPAYAACALTDDLTYQANGGAGNGTEPLNRQGRYNWAALIQRPDNSKPDQIDVTILVFDGRPPFLASQGDEVVLTNDAANNVIYFTGATPGSRSLALNVPNRGADRPPLVRRGGWVAVASMDGPAVAGGTRGVSFHRITGLTTSDDDQVAQYAGGPQVTVTPAAVDIDPPIPAAVSANPQVYLLTGLSEVFPRAKLFNE
jgi:Tfp pilus assembly protein PilV